MLAGWLVLRAAVLKPRSLWGVAALSGPVVPFCHIATFVVAAHATGPTLSVSRMVPLALLVLLIVAVPTNVGGWGHARVRRRGSLAQSGWALPRAVATATLFGVMVTVTTLPGGVRLALDTAGRRISSSRQASPSQGTAHA